MYICTCIHRLERSRTQQSHPAVSPERSQTHGAVAPSKLRFSEGPDRRVVWTAWLAGWNSSPSSGDNQPLW